MKLLNNRELRQLVERNGWVLRYREKHFVYKHPISGDTLIVSHKHRTVPPTKGMLCSIYKKIVANGGSLD